MKLAFSTRPLLAAAIVLGSLAAASAAHARTDVTLSIGFPAPFGYVQPQPVYVQPQPVYVQPEPVYYQRQPVYVQPAPVYVQPQYGHQRHHRWQERRGAWGDADRDGVPNAYDRAPYNPYRR